MWWEISGMNHSMEPVVVTGAGVLACNGMGLDSFWKAIVSGASGIRTVDRFDVENLPSKIAGQLWDFDPSDYLSKKVVDRWYRATHQAVVASILAVEDAEFASAGYDPERVAAGIGTSFGATDEMYHHNRRTFETQGWRGMDKLSSSATSDHAPTATVGSHFGFRGPAITIGSGCSTGIDMLAWGRKQVSSGLADAALIGATETPLNELLYASTCALGILSERNNDPDKAMRPFDAKSDGFVLSEAAVVLVLERASSARARGAKIYAEVAGCGASAEGRNPLILDKEGDALARAMEAALREAGVLPDELDCAQSHGVSVKMYDRCEASAYRKALGANAYRIPISANKSMIGQAYSVGGLLGVVCAMMSLKTGVVPPTINLETPDPECDLDFVPKESRLNDPASAIVTALSFGGTHTAAVLKRAG